MPSAKENEGVTVLELAIRGNRYYWIWLTLLLYIITVGTTAYLIQFNVGLAVTGLSRDVFWGIYITQLTFNEFGFL